MALSAPHINKSLQALKYNRSFLWNEKYKGRETEYTKETVHNVEHYHEGNDTQDMNTDNSC